MARYVIAYVCPGQDQRERSWVLGAIANDDQGCAVAPNPGLDAAAVAAATRLSRASLAGWADMMSEYIAERGLSRFDPASNGYEPLPATSPDFLGALVADGAGEVNFYYSDVQEQSGSAAEVARSVAGGPEIAVKLSGR